MLWKYSFFMLLNCKSFKTSLKKHLYRMVMMTEDILSNKALSWSRKWCIKSTNQVSGNDTRYCCNYISYYYNDSRSCCYSRPVVPVPPVVIIPDHDLCNSPLRGRNFLKNYLINLHTFSIHKVCYVFFFFSEVLNDTYTYTWTKKWRCWACHRFKLSRIFPNSVMNNLGDGNIVNIITLQQLMVQGSSPSERKNSSWSVRISSNKCPIILLFFNNSYEEVTFKIRGFIWIWSCWICKTPTEKFLKVCLSGWNLQFRKWCSTFTALTVTENRSKDTSLWNKCLPGVSYTVPVNLGNSGVWWFFGSFLWEQRIWKSKNEFLDTRRKKGR